MPLTNEELNEVLERVEDALLNLQEIRTMIRDNQADSQPPGDAAGSDPDPGGSDPDPGGSDPDPGGSDPDPGGSDPDPGN